MPGLSVSAENSAGWRILWDLINARILEEESRVQTAQDKTRTEVNDHENKKLD
jgi:hypothetical protein